MSLTTNFDLEHKITYNELSPSLQALFKSLQTQITDNRNEITKLDNRVTNCENRITELESISHEVEITGEQAGYPITIRRINMKDGKQLIEQYFTVDLPTSGGGNPEVSRTVIFPEPMDRVIAIMRDPMWLNGKMCWIDGDWWIYNSSLNGAGFVIQYDSVHEVNNNHTFRTSFHVIGYKLTGEAPDPPDVPDPGDPGDTESPDDKIDKLEETVAKLVPIGTVRYAYTKPSDDWVKANGALLSRTDYKELYEYANTNGLIVSEQQWNSGYTNNYSYIGLYSSGDGSTTFRIPDYRSCFIRGLDDGRNIDKNRILGTEQLPTLIPGYEDQIIDGPNPDFTFGYLHNSYNKGSDTINTSNYIWESRYQDYNNKPKWYSFSYKFNGGYNIGNRDKVYWLNDVSRNDVTVPLPSPELYYGASRSRNIALTVWIKAK